jgi:microcystin-dependent protein
MPNNYILKDFEGGAEKTTLTAAMTGTATSFSVVDGSSYPSGTNPFVVVVDRGLATEEKILVSGRITNSFSVLERAYDGSSAQSHALGATVEHCVDAFTIEQANRYVNLQTAKGDLVAHNGTTTQKLGVGADDLVLIADSAQSNGVKWAQITEDSIASSAISAIANQVESLIAPSDFPAGIVTSFAGSTAPAGWLICDGTLKQTSAYPNLFNAIGYAYGGSGSQFGVPNLKGRVPVGLDATQTEFDVLNDQGGAKTHTLITAEMPQHNHTGTTASSGNHAHNYQDHPRNPSVTYASGSGGQDRTAVADQTDTAGAHTHTFTTGNTGSGSAHNNLQPYIVLNYIIKT